MEKNRTTAILLSLFLGGLGIHKFYLNQTVKGILYLIFGITGIPSILAFIDFIKFIIWDDAKFQDYIEKNAQ
ncbi:MAG: TM2 domain-containing protein [bacterium]|nr:TM2 domain-containing protein [bacterium]